MKPKEFKAFFLRGNVVDLAVGIVTGVAFGALVTALVADFTAYAGDDRTLPQGTPG